MRRISALLSGLLLLGLLATTVPVFAQGTGNPRLVFQTTLPNVRQIKFPDVAGAGNMVYLSANVNRADAYVWEKQDSAQAFGLPVDLGQAPGQPDFSSTSVATGPDGSVHYIWLNQETRRIHYRYKPAGGAWGPERTVYAGSGSAFPVNATVEVASDGQIFVAWRDPDRPVFVARSTNNGQSWTSPIVIGSDAVFNFPALAAGPNGAMALAYTIGENDRLVIYGGTWNGSTFATARITPFAGDGFADPTLTYDTAGTLYVAYRGVDNSGSSSGVWVATNQGAGQWQINRIVGPGEVYGTVNIEGDTSGNLHLQWNANVGAGQRVYYSVRPSGATAFVNPIDAPNDAGIIFNSRMSTTVSDAAYAHVAGELFQGDSSFLRYILFAATPGTGGGGGGGAGQPVIEDGDQITEKEPTVTVNFTNIQGQPTQIRWRWGSAPSDTESDSNGWQNFSNPIEIPLPESILSDTPCSAERLYTQLREGTAAAGQAQSDDIVIDTGIDAARIVSNPYIHPKASQFTPTNLVTGNLADPGAGGASDGDPRYTRAPIYYLELRGVNDCSGVKDLAAARATTSFPKAITLTDENFANVLGYQGAMVEGPNQVVVRVTDKAGNVETYTESLTFDPTRPVLAATGAGTVTAASNPEATILVDLTFAGINVTDNLYPGRGYWGVWIANSRTQVADPATDASLIWSPVEAPGTTDDFVITNWSLATNLSGALAAGEYYVYVRFLDGAGNATAGHLTASVTLSQVTRPQVGLPIVRTR
jgi:hypothetical protein